MGRHLVVGFGILLGFAAACTGDGTPTAPATQPAGAQPQTIAELLATRPAPKLAGLAQRSHPDAKGPDATESFFDILKLRETGDQKAVPILAEILASNAGTGRIHGYAAAQALFCIGGNEARVALDKHLFQLDEYNEQWGRSTYVFHWDMPEPRRSQYIQAYMLKRIGQGLELTLEAKLEEDGKVQFSLRVENVSTKPLGVILPSIDNLYLRSEDGRFLFRNKAARFDPFGGPQWVRLKPGETQTVTGVAVIRQAGDLRKDNPQLPKDAQAVLEMAGTQYYIEKPGQHQAVFVLEQLPMTRELEDRLKLENPWSGLENPWSGRAVSEPVPIRLATPSRTSKPKERS